MEPRYVQKSSRTWVEETSNPGARLYRVGTNPHEIAEGDLILMGVIFVSPGAVAPLLRLRDEYGRYSMMSEAFVSTHIFKSFLISDPVNDALKPQGNVTLKYPIES